MSSIYSNYIFNTIKLLSSILIPLITFPYVTRILGPENIGKIDFVTNLATNFYLFAACGIPFYGVREISKYKDSSQKEVVFKELLLINMVMTVVVAGAYFLSILIIRHYFHDTRLLLLFSIFIIFTPLGVDWLYQGLERFRFVTIRHLIIQLIALASLFVFVTKKEDYFSYAIIVVGSLATANLINFVYSRKLIDWRQKTAIDPLRHIKPLSIFLLLNVFVSFYSNANFILLGFLSSNEEVGYFTTSHKIVNIVFILILSIETVLLPKSSYYLEHNLHAEYKSALKKAFSYLFMLTLPAFAGFVCLSSEIIHIFAGDQYVKSITVLTILSIHVITGSVANIINSQVVLSSGREKISLYAAIVGGIVCVVLNIILIPYFGAIGTAIAFSVSWVVILGVFIFFTWGTIRDVIFDIKAVRYIAGSIVIAGIVVSLKLFIENIYILTIVGVSISFIFYMSFLLLLKDELLIEIRNYMFSILRSAFSSMSK
ncbi:MAG: flippase [Spirochaetes bacterium]|nr:flippase [Spirochaetota bacterium]